MKTYQTKILSLFDEQTLPFAAEVLKSGELVAFPTDTVYGLGCSPFLSESLHRIYEVKQRPEEKAIPVLLGSLDQLCQVVSSLPDRARGLMEAFWPGPLTLVLPHQPELPLELSPYPGIAVRMPNHDLALALLRRTGPLAVTSANISTHQNSLSAQDVYEQLNTRIPFILDDGSKPGGTASTVINCMEEQPHLLREGPISFQEILEKWNSNEQA